MTTPGGHPYGGAQQPQGGQHDQNRFNFPSAPSRPVPEHNPYQQQPYGQPQQPQHPRGPRGSLRRRRTTRWCVRTR